MKKILICYDPPPIPIRTLDYCAYFDGADDNAHFYAHGPTWGEAVRNLLDQTEDLEESELPS